MPSSSGITQVLQEVSEVREGGLSRIPPSVLRARLPLEVCELIIDFAAEFWEYSDFCEQPRRTTLHACALTCRAWVPRCRYHLFYTSDLLQNADHLAGYVRMLRAHPDLTTLARRLRISGTFDNVKAHWISTLPLSLCPLLPNLTHIVFTAQVSKQLTPFHPQFFQTLSQFKTVTELHYTCHACQPFSNFCRFVLAFHNLRRLHVDGELAWEKAGCLDELTPPPGILMTRRNSVGRRRQAQVQYLHLSPYLLQRNMINVVGFLRLTIDTSALTTLEVWDVRWREAHCDAPRAVGELIRACENLRNVILHVTLFGSPVLDPGMSSPFVGSLQAHNSLSLELLTFSNNRYLQTLELQISYLPRSFKLFCDILASVSSPAFYHLTLRMNVDETEIARDLKDDPAAMEKILCGPAFSGLRWLSTDLPEPRWPKFFGRLQTRRHVTFERVDRMDSEGKSNFECLCEVY